jgi:hypothetical protein
MPTLNDRGYALVSKNDDGTTTVVVCAGVEDGEPIDVLAMHVRQPKVNIWPNVQLVRAKSHYHTEEVVEVFTGDGAVHVRALPHRKEQLP